MFICIEIDSEDITIWEQIDKMLASEIGATHIIWGVAGGKNTACKLPSNLFYVNTIAEASDVNAKVKDIVTNLWFGAYRTLTTHSKIWCSSDTPFTKPKLTTLKIKEEETEDSISMREV